MNQIADVSGPVYTGKVHPNCDYYHGQIPYMKGVHLYQAARANRRHPELDDGTGHTYKHAPDLTWYHGRFYIQYLTNPKNEHDGAGMSVLVSSEDGVNWDRSCVSFPEYWIEPCIITDGLGRTHRFQEKRAAFMHQRMAFFLSSDDVMLVSGFYGWSPEMWITNWDYYGIGRAVRRLYPDGTLGDCYFIDVNWQGGWSEEQLNYPVYTECSDRIFVKACEELLRNSLYRQQWAEESGDRADEIVVKHPENGTYQAFCWYSVSDQELVGLWKHSFTSRSHDGGKSWEKPVKSPSLVMSGQKIWGCRTDDGRFALIYDPTLETQHRFPLCIVTGDDGYHFDDMLLVHGEVPPMRYAGFWKDMGPQYMRGICEGLPRPEESDICLTYSVNKEDIWFAKLPVPVSGCQSEPVYEMFYDEQKLKEWNIYCPKWSSVSADEAQTLLVRESEPCDHVALARLVQKSEVIETDITIKIEELNRECIRFELRNSRHQTAVRLVFRPKGVLNHRTVCELGLGSWQENEPVRVQIQADCSSFDYTVSLNGRLQCGSDGKPVRYRFMAAVNEISELSVCTGKPAYLADLEQNPDGLPECTPEKLEEPAEEICYRICSFSANKIR